MAQTKIVFLVLPHLHLIDLAGPLQVFLEAKDYGAKISIEYCSLEEPVNTSASIPLGELNHFSDVQLTAGDYLFIPGTQVASLLSKKMFSEIELIRWVQTAYQQGAYVCSVCTGAFFLALTGLLDGKKCTTHWKHTKDLKQRFPAITLMEDILYVEDNRVYTSAGVTAGVDLALHILEKISDENTAHKVARELVVYIRRNGSESQQSIFMKFRSHIHSGIHVAQDYLQDNVGQRVSLMDVADKACMSVRNLTRTFKKETGITVNTYTSLLRKELLRQLSMNADMNRKQMARRCGLRSVRQVIRLLKTI